MSEENTHDTTKAAALRSRPLSPHLQIYRPQLTSILSVFHRATGIALSGGAVVLVAWLVAVAMGGLVWNGFVWAIDSWLGIFVLMGWSWSLMYHLCTGIRHLIWDTGHRLEIKEVYTTGYIALVISAVLTAIIWLFGFVLALPASGVLS